MPIDRKALVQRHNPTHNGSFDPMSPFSVGNGDFAVTVDGSGLQTMWHEPLPSLTMANAAWHSFTPERPSLRLKEYDANGRSVGYMSDPSGQEEAFTILRHNPHKANLAKIGFTHPAFDDSNALFEAIGDLTQTLDLYEGTITSTYTLLEEPVHVQTFVHPTKAVLCVSISSPLLTTGLGVEFAFPYPSVELSASDWNEESKHTSILTDHTIIRVVDDLSYSLTVHSEENTTLVQKAPHRFLLMSEAATLTLSVAFDFFDTPTQNFPFSLALKENRSHWVHFWETGAAISFNTTVTRAFELERRIILSLYLLAIQSLGSFPSAETGLTVNSWYGKFHLEMHPFHALFAPFWGKGELLKRSLWYYQSIRESAQKRAQEQGYEGLRWPKMTDQTAVTPH
ncbi:MAG: hypothetical protein WC954_04845, partial [Sphaerochaeta sp.]